MTNSIKTWILLLTVLAGSVFGQQLNTDVIPASPGLNLGHSNQPWNAFVNNLTISGTCTLSNGQPCTAQPINSFTVATLPSNLPVGALAQVTDAASPESCTAGGGINVSICRWTGTVWQTTGDGASRANVAFAPGLSGFGDSIVVGAGSQNSTSGIQGFYFLASPDFNEQNIQTPQNTLNCNGTPPFGSQQHNFACPGDQAEDMTKKVLQTLVVSNSRNPVIVSEVGINDATQFHEASQSVALFFGSMRASIDWGTTPESAKVAASNCAKGGTWVTDTGITLADGFNALLSTTSASTLTCTLVSTGAPIELAYRLYNTNGGGTATVTIDAVGQTDSYSGNSTLSATGSGNLTINGLADEVVMARFPNIASGTHTIVITISSTTSSANQFGVVWVGSVPLYNSISTTQSIANLGAPLWFQLGVPRQQGVSMSSTCATPDFTACYDTDIQSIVNGLAADGHNVIFVPIRNRLDSTADMFNSKHPNDAGHRKMRDALAFAAQQSLGRITGCVVNCSFFVGTGDFFNFQPTTASAALAVANQAQFVKFFNSSYRLLASTAFWIWATTSAGGHGDFGVYAITGGNSSGTPTSTLTLIYHTGSVSTTTGGVQNTTGIAPVVLLPNTSYYIAWCADNTTAVPASFVGGGTQRAFLNAGTANTFGTNATDTCSTGVLPTTVTISNITNTSSNMDFPAIFIQN